MDDEIALKNKEKLTNSSKTSIIIRQPNEPIDVPPQKESPVNNSHEVGFNLIQGIYGFFLIKKPVAFSVLERYKKKLDIKFETPYLYYFFLFLCLFIDILFASVISIIIATLLLIIVLSFARGIGIFDWLPEIVNNFKS